MGQAFLTAGGRGLLLGGAVLVVVAGVRRWGWGILPWNGRVALAVALAAGGFALITAWARRRTLPQTAAVLDRLGNTRDRFVSALGFSPGENAPALQALAVQECTTFLRGGDFARLVRLRLPRELPYLVVPALALALLQWEARVTFSARDAQAAAGRHAVEDTARQLELLARKVETASETDQSAELRRLAEEMKRRAEALRTQATDPAAAEKAALRELSALEQSIQQMQKAQPSPEEMQALAEALQKNEPTRDAAAALAAGDLEKAVAALKKAEQEMAEKKDERTPEEIAQALQDALKQLAQKQALSQALQQLADQLQQKAGGSSEVLQQLAELLQKLPKSNGQPRASAGQPADAQTLKNLLAALQNMKFGDGSDPAEGEGQPGGAPPGSVAMQSFAKKPDGGDGKDGQLPSGLPGSENDQGTTASPFGKKALKPGDGGTRQEVTGRLGEGESLSQLAPSTGDSSKSQQRYKELYEAMAPAAEDALVQENVPLGSRFFIKRYFQSIRPAP